MDYIKVNQPKKIFKNNWVKSDHYEFVDKINRSKYDTVILFPSSKCLIAYYCPDFGWGLLGTDSLKIFNNYCKRLDTMYHVEKISKDDAKQMRASINKYTVKYNSKINRHHNAISTYLTQRFKNIYLPDLRGYNWFEKTKNRYKCQEVKDYYQSIYDRFYETFDKKCSQVRTNHNLIEIENNPKLCSYCGSVNENYPKVELDCKNCPIKINVNLNNGINNYAIIFNKTEKV